MKKVILMAAVVCATVLASCSSKTCYKCTGSTGGVLDAGEWCADTYTADQLSGFETACNAAEGTWATK